MYQPVCKNTVKWEGQFFSSEYTIVLQYGWTLLRLPLLHYYLMQDSQGSTLTYLFLLLLASLFAVANLWGSFLLITKRCGWDKKEMKIVVIQCKLSSTQHLYTLPLSPSLHHSPPPLVGKSMQNGSRRNRNRWTRKILPPSLCPSLSHFTPPFPVSHHPSLPQLPSSPSHTLNSSSM